MYRVGFMIIVASLATAAPATERSVVTVPIAAPLEEIEARLNRDLPTTLVDQNMGQTCVEAQQVCTKIPEFRGFKIYSRMECVQTTPAIDCSFEQRASRSGPLRLSGSGPTLIVQQHITGEARVRGRGEIGRHISQSASGAGDFTLRADPSIAPDWTPVIHNLSHNVSWTRPPTAMLFNIFRVTFRGEAESALAGAVERFRTQSLPQELAGLGLREKASRAWVELQRPVSVSLPGDQVLWVHFRPEGIGMDPLTFDDNVARTRLSIAGEVRATDSETSPFEGGRTALPSLTAPPVDEGIAIDLPLDVGLDTLTNVLSADLPQSLTMDGPLSGSIIVRSGRLITEGEALVARLEISTDIAGFRAYEGPMIIAGTPRLDDATLVLSLHAPRLIIESEDWVTGLLARVLDNSAMRRWIAHRAHVPLGDKIAKTEQSLRQSIVQSRPSGLRLVGDVDIGATGLVVEDGRLRVTLRARGRLAVIGLDLR